MSEPENTANGVSTSPVPTLGSIPPTLAGLFDRDPLGLTRVELNAIVETLRAQRKAFVEAEGAARVAGKRVNAKAALKGVKTTVDIGKLLEDL